MMKTGDLRQAQLDLLLGKIKVKIVDEGKSSRVVLDMTPSPARFTHLDYRAPAVLMNNWN
jgi:hypothetical protein